jgi:hydroxyacylglutathione hydrolase
MNALEYVPVPAFEDNYIWVVSDGHHAVVVDPGEAAPVRAYLAKRGWRLNAILLTHHHQDHVGGVADLLNGQAVPVYGPAGEAIEHLTHRLKNGDHVTIAAPVLEFSVLDVPGHTSGHIAYFQAADPRGTPHVFCGDTLFACGCGRLFEGTPQQMVTSLAKLAALPDDTRVYCAHEYTLANIRFAQAVEPGNKALAAREAADAEMRRLLRPTLPSTIGREKATNPFLRYREPQVVEAANRHAGKTLGDPVQVFAAIRDWKNNF